MLEWIVEWLTLAFPHSLDIRWEFLMARLFLAAVLGGAVAVIYRLTHRSDSPTLTFLTTLVMLCMLTAIVTIVIGESTARAFGLVGALSIVRFRTMVEDTRDTAFVVFAVVVGMAAGMGNFWAAAIGFAIVSVVVTVQHLLQGRAAKTPGDWTLQLRVGTGLSGDPMWERLIGAHCDQANLQSTATARQGASLDLTYKLRLKAEVTPMQFLNEMNRLEGIQNIELRRN